MNWKKVLLIAFALVLTLGLVACGDDTNGDTNGEDTAAPAAEALNIVIVTSPSGVDDGSFNQTAYEGIQDFISMNPDSTVHHVLEPDMDNAVAAVGQVVADYDVAVLAGFQFAGITEVAQNNPDTYFILIDIFPADPEGGDDPVVLDNVYAMQFAEQESGFLAGIAAAMETETGKVGFIGGMAIPPVVNYHFGFISGVEYANSNLDANAEIVNLSQFGGTDVRGVDIAGNYVGAFNDEAQGKVVAEALIAADVDVLFVAAGGSGNGAFTAAKETTDVWVIGCDVDQWHLGEDGDRNIVLTSALKVIDINVVRVLSDIANDAFMGGNYVLTAAEDSTGLVTYDGSQQLDAATIDAINDAFDAVKAGTIVPASNFNEIDPTDFPGL
ncbi:MAG: BMP family ABC transporter substrate-binding protein [Coriobacteriia bacterium]|nr:BMP family ABC transporter substrate-binding protein [Coriobacteriia bacterium]